MQLKPIKVGEEDLVNHRALAHVIKNGDFQLKGNAVTRVSQLLQWYDKLYIKLEEVIQKEKLDAMPKLPVPDEEPKKPVKKKATK